MCDSDSEEESVIRYGTPLEPYEEDELPSKRQYQQQPDQFAVDAHGRRRFHGAFTGGFSAGYGNTVGTPEGWTPATFKSSRSEKAQHTANQKPEDFMDEEDRSEFGIAPRQVHTQSDFSGRKRARQHQYHDGPIPGEPVLEQLVRAVHETAAVRMLRAMGWREGRGTGDRLTRSERRRAAERRKVYGCYMPPDMRQNTESHADDENSDSELSESEYDTLFAPDDYDPCILQRKNDRFGLGYSGLSRHSVLGNLVGQYGDAGPSKSHLVMKDKGKKVSIRGHAFGVGALEADDEDIYAVEDMSHYDFATGATDDPAKKKKPSDKSADVLEGFVRASKPSPPVASYPPPALPRDYTPAPAGARRSRFEPAAHHQRDQGLGRHELTAEARGALLGETPVPKASVVADTQTKPLEREDPVAKLVGRNVNFVTTNIAEDGKDKELDYISIKDSGKELDKVFKPFASNPQKQARYERYCKDSTSLELEQDKMDRLSKWERERELVEFEQAAKLYKPLTGVMGDRFTHASEPDDALNPLTAVAKSAVNYGLATEEQIEAAKKGAYGVMTRHEAPWRPDPIICKRFNIPDPAAVRTEPKVEDKPKVSYSVFSYLESSVHDKESFAKEQTKFSGSKSLSRDPESSKLTVTNQANNNAATTESKISTAITATGFTKRLTVAELFLKESEKAIQDKDKNVEVTEKISETINKFDKMDLYKSIFLSDSENDDEPVKNSKTKNNAVNDFVDVPKNEERNPSPPRGIFANIDFDELNSWKRNIDNKKPEEKIDNTGQNKPNNAKVEGDGITENNDSKIEETAANDTYGPKIPENLKKRLEEMSPAPDKDSKFKPVFRNKDDRQKEIEMDSSSSSDSWVEAKEVSKKVKKKKSKKHKAKHKKSKHKKKNK